MREVVEQDVIVERGGQAAFARPAPHSKQAYEILHWGFVAAPVLAGLDKFTCLLGDWDRYLAPQARRLLPVKPRTFMRAVGVVEVAAGAIVAVKPRIGAWVVAGWLGGIIGNLALHRRRYLDIALRDFGLALGAIALARLAAMHDRPLGAGSSSSASASLH